VTGGAGYIGSHTCKALARAGFTPVTYDNLSSGHRQAVQWGPLVEGDLANQVLLDDVLREYSIKAVIHFAAYAYVGESMHHPGKYFRNNVANSLNLLQAMQDAGVMRIVFSSSCATYGMPEELPIRENHPRNPVNPYGESKLFIERALSWLDSAHDLRSATLRYFNAAGADPASEIGENHEPETHLIPLAIQSALGQRQNVEIFGTDYPTPDGTAIRDYIHVGDLAAAHVAALQHLLRGGESTTLNLGTGNGYSVRQIIAAVERISGCPVPFLESARRAGDPPELVADAGKAASVLNWVPEYSDLDTIVETAWRWHQRQSDDSVSHPRGRRPARGARGSDPSAISQTS
jgi:UDP-glucose-4-epimerase GalE